jgi:hypothetical protein
MSSFPFTGFCVVTKICAMRVRVSSKQEREREEKKINMST